MAEAPYTQLRQNQFRGPSTSDDYNARIEENYKDIVVLYNQLRVLNTDMAEQYRHIIKDMVAMSRVASEVESRVANLETANNSISFYNTSQLDTDRFNATAFNIPVANRLTHDSQHGLLTLPKIDVSSLSKLFFVDNTGFDVVPPTLETRVLPDPLSADSPTAVVESSQPELAVVRRAGRIWERNVVVPSINASGAMMNFYLKVPTDLYTTDKSNCLLLDPYPAFSTDIMNVSYTTNPEAIMQDSDGYTALNSTAMHFGNPDALTWVPPGGFASDEYIEAGPRLYYFDPRPITGLRIRLRTKKFLPEGGQYVYSYGLSRLDLRYDRFMNTGKIILKFNAPAGHTISQVTDVLPQLWNVAGTEWPTTYAWRAIWETSLNSGSYTTTPVSSSSRVWIELTLNETLGKASPALSGAAVEFV